MIISESKPTLNVKTINKNTLTVNSNSPSIASITTSQFIFFRISKSSIGLNTESDFVTYNSIKLRFRQTSSNIEGIPVSISTENYFVTGDSFTSRCVNENGILYREIDLTNELLKSSDDTLYFAFYNADGLNIYTDHAADDYKPVLIKNYHKNTTITKNEKYLEGSTGYDQYKINLRTNRLDYSLNLVSIRGLHLPLEMMLNYNLDNTTSSQTLGFPIGWCLNYHQKIVASGNDYKYYDGAGYIHIFKLSQDNQTYYEENGNYLIMKINSSSSEKYVISDENNSRLIFNSSGYLTKIAKRVSSTKEYNIVIDYDSSNRIIKVTDGGGNISNISYDTTNKQILISKPKINSTTGESENVIITYDSVNCLTSVKLNEVETINYEYLVKNNTTRAFVRPTSYQLNIVRALNKRINFSYITDTKRISQIDEYCTSFSTQLLCSYKLNSRKMMTQLIYTPYSTIDNDGSIKVNYHFDENGFFIRESEVVSSNKFGMTSIINYSKEIPYQIDNSSVEVYESLDDETLYCVNGNLTHLIELSEEELTSKTGYNIFIEYSNDYVGSVSINDTQLFQIKDGNKTIASIPIPGEMIETNVVSMYFETANNYPSLVISSGSLGERIIVKKIKVYGATKKCPVMLTSISENNGNGITIDGIEYYENISPITFKIGTNEYQNIRLTYNDYIKNVNNYNLAQKSGELVYNVWYNDGASMLGGVSGLKYCKNGIEKGISSFKFINFSGNKKFYLYESLEYNSNTNLPIIKNISKAKGYDDSTRYILKELDAYGNVISESNERGIKRAYSYTDGNIIEEELSLADDEYNQIYESINETDTNIKKHYSYSNNRLSCEYEVCNNVNIGNNYFYDNRGNIRKIEEIGFPRYYEYHFDTTNELLDKIYFNNSNNYNSIVYLDDRIEEIYRKNTLTASYTYNSYNEIDGCSLYDNNHKTIVQSINNGLLTELVVYSTGEHERITYDKFKRVKKIERKDASSSEYYKYMEYKYGNPNYSTDDTESMNTKLLRISNSLSDGRLYVNYSYNNTGQISAFSYENFLGSSNTYYDYFAIPYAGMEQVLSTTAVETKINRTIHQLETVTQGKISETKANNIYKEIKLYDDNEEVEKIFIESLIEEKLGRGYKALYQISNQQNGILQQYSKKYVFYNGDNGSSNFISQQIDGIGNVINNDVTKTINYSYNLSKISSVVTDGKTTTYAYDAYGRIIRENNQALSKSYTYAYDDYGNITSKKVYNYSTGSLSESSKLDEIIYSYSSTYKDRLVKINNSTVTYNSGGQPIVYKSHNITWKFGKMTSYDSYQYKYDPNGLRYFKELNDKKVLYYYDGNRLLKESHTTLDYETTYYSISYIYGNQGIIGFRYQSGSTSKYYYYRKNIFGDVIEIYYNNTVVGKYEYDAWGNHVAVINIDGIANINPIRYRGYYYDEETQLFYCNSRYYSPELCRFISPDDVEYLDPESVNGLNLYCYCYNNPIMYVDNFGYFPVAIDAITTIVNGVMELYEFGLKWSLKSFKNAPKITMDIAKKMARKSGHIQSARKIMRNQQKLIDSTQQSIDDVAKFGKKMGKALLVADIAWSLGENIAYGEESWFTNTLVDAGISLAIYGLSLLPGGFFITLATTVATSILEDEIKKFKDDFYDVWSNFWSFSWI